MKKIILTLAVGTSLLSFTNAGNATDAPPTQHDLIQNYADFAYKAYVASHKDALALQSAVNAFIATPTDQTLETAKQAWLKSRESYGQTEAFRFYEGPIDFYDAEKDLEGPEGRLNAWPLNEAYIDYVYGAPNAGIIQDKTIEISAETLKTKNQADDEADVATGYHAIEFLLWGQDLNMDSAGKRPVSDYTSDTPTAARRSAYLKAVTDLLVEDVKFLVDQWAPEHDNYAKKFIAGGDESLTKIMTGLATLSGFELASERMATALDSGDQEDEHSCFSDNTHNDFIYNAQGVFNVFFNTGLYEYIKSKDEHIAEELEDQLIETKKQIESLPSPIDREILSTPANSEARQNMEHAIVSLQKEADLLKEAGNALGLNVQIIQ